MSLIVSDKVSLIVGAGVTGLSAARYFDRTKQLFRVYDTRTSSVYFEPFKKINAELSCYSGDFKEAYLSGIYQLILSPGVSRNEPVVLRAIELGIPVKSDIKLFLEHVSQPVIGITGSNGKSSVTTMVGMAAERAGIHVAVGGNLGTAALDLIADDVDLYVLELSSFQLESTDAAALEVAVNLNVSPDHLDRHGTMLAYFQAKQKVFHSAKHVVYNLNDPLTKPPVVRNVKRFGFGLKPGVEKTEIQYFLSQDRESLLRDGVDLMERTAIKQGGLHNTENILAVFAIAEAANIPQAAVVEMAKAFSGLKHRCEMVDVNVGITFINDSKATNVGATQAALEGFYEKNKKLILIAGGVAKGADFQSLGDAIAKYVDYLVLMGADSNLIQSAVNDRVPNTRVDNLHQAVSECLKHAASGDSVLFSPACASFDMFHNFEDRGDRFREVVQELCA